MSGLGLPFSVLLAATLLVSLWSAERRKKRMGDPDADGSADDEAEGPKP